MKKLLTIIATLTLLAGLGIDAAAQTNRQKTARRGKNQKQRLAKKDLEYSFSKITYNIYQPPTRRTKRKKNY